MKYWQKLLMLLFLTAVALTAGLSYVIYRTTNRISDQITITGRNILSKQAEEFLSEIVDEQANILSLQLNNIKTALLNGAHILRISNTNLSDESQIEDILHFMHSNGGTHCRQAFFRYTDGRLLTASLPSSHHADEAHVSLKINTETFKIEAQKSINSTWRLELDANQSAQRTEPIINAIAPVMRGRLQVGEIGLSVAIQDLIYQINQDQTIRGSYTFLMNDQGLLIAAPVNARVELAPQQAYQSLEFIDLSRAGTPEMDKLYKLIALGQEGIIEATIGLNRKYFAYHPVGDTSWRLCVSAPVALVTAPSVELSNDVALVRDKALKENLLLAVTILMLVLVIGGWFARHMTLPLLKMTALTRKIASGNFEHRIDLRRRDEIGQLSRDFNSMSIQLHKMINSYENQAAQLERVNQELKAENHERKQAEEQVRRLNSDLEQRVVARTAELTVAKQQAESANQAKSEFLARMSHEIRTPLNAITGLTNVLLKSALTSEQQDYLAKVQLANKNLLQVINDILDFSKIEAGLLEMTTAPFDVDRVMTQMADLFNDQISTKRLALNISVDRNIPKSLTGDEARISQVLINLIQNAIKFTENGRITVGLQQEISPPDDHGRLPFKFWVSDTGIGISADTLPILFDPFTQAEGYMERRHQGTGLGLSICQRLVDLMGGRIWVETSPGKGSTFYFTVMLAPGEDKLTMREQTNDESANEPQQKQKTNGLSGRRVLVVEDSELNREVAVALLESANIVVATAENGQVAYDMLIGSEPGHFDAVLMDIQMPIMDGFEATRQIRAWETRVNSNRHRIPIIALTAHALKGEKEKCIAAEMDDYLPKPIDESDLFQTLGRWVTSGK